MIIKGSTRGQSAADTAALARHLLAAENEHVRLLELRGVSSVQLPDALEEMRLLMMGSRARRGLYHASINLDQMESGRMGTVRWLAAADELEQRLGMQGHQRAVVLHVKRGREHAHVVWCRVHPATLRLARDDHNYRRHEECSRALEERWGLRPVVGAHTRPQGTPRPVALATHGDWQAQERTGVVVRDVAAALNEAWCGTRSGRAFAAAIERDGLWLARGRRGIVVIDEAGTPHSLPRRLRLRAAEVHKRLADIDEMVLPTVDGLKAALRRNKGNTMNKPNAMNTSMSACDAKPRRGRPAFDRRTLSPEYWRALGYQVDELTGMLLVRLRGGTLLEDRGDRLTLKSSGEPTDEEIRLIVAAGKARGWESIRFFGGSPEWQRRARVEALRQGYRFHQISLECEDGSPQPLAAAPMPEHIRNKLAPPAAPADVPAPAAPAAPTPGREMRP